MIRLLIAIKNLFTHQPHTTASYTVAAHILNTSRKAGRWL